MTQTPAGWFPDPDDTSQFRYWDGTAWTEHRSPRSSAASDQMAQAGSDLAEGLSKAFSAVGGWVEKNVGSPKQPTFASVAASCVDAPALSLSRSLDLVVDPADWPGWVSLFATSSSALGPIGDTLESPCRLVPNPWNPADPNGVAVFVGTTMVGRLPAEAAAEYSPVLTPLASAGRLVTGTVAITAAGDSGHVTSGSAVAQVPEPSSITSS